MKENGRAQFFSIIVPEYSVDIARGILRDSGIILNPADRHAFVKNPDGLHQVGSLIEGFGTTQACSEAVNKIPNLVNSHNSLMNSFNEDETVLCSFEYAHDN